jgi:kynureninase
MNTLTVNLHVLLASFYQPTHGRYRILMEQSAFPSDRYAVVSQLALHGHTAPDALIEVQPLPGEDLIGTGSILEAIERAGDSLALVLLPGVQYLTGQVFDIAAITRAGHRAGAMVGWDLAHAIGNIPLSLHDAGADFAAWCSYKYLCGGPGAVGGAFVHARHGHDTGIPRLAGWWGHDAATRFLMGPGFVPMAGAEGWQLSNPPILSLAPLIAALETFDAAGAARLHAKSVALTAFVRARLAATCTGAIRIVTPAGTGEHGAQLSLRLRDGASHGRAVHARLMAAGIICDWREPDIIRLAPSPLYNSFSDVDRAVAQLAAAIGTP